MRLKTILDTAIATASISIFSTFMVAICYVNPDIKGSIEIEKMLNLTFTAELYTLALAIILRIRNGGDTCDYHWVHMFISALIIGIFLDRNHTIMGLLQILPGGASLF